MARNWPFGTFKPIHADTAIEMLPTSSNYHIACGGCRTQNSHHSQFYFPWKTIRKLERYVQTMPNHLSPALEPPLPHFDAKSLGYGRWPWPSVASFQCFRCGFLWLQVGPRIFWAWNRIAVDWWYFWTQITSFRGFHKYGYPKWMVYKGKSY